MQTEHFSSDVARVRTILSAISTQTPKQITDALDSVCDKGGFPSTRLVLQSVIGMLVSDPKPSPAKVHVAELVLAKAMARDNGLSVLADMFETSVSSLPAAHLGEAFSSLFGPTLLKLNQNQFMYVVTALCLSSTDAVKEAALDLFQTTASKFANPATLREAYATKDSVVLTISMIAGGIPALCNFSAGFSAGPVTLLLSLGADSTVDHNISLAGLIEELGSSCISSIEDCRELLNMYPTALTTKCVAEVVALLASPGQIADDNSVTYNALRSSMRLDDTKAASSTNAQVLPQFILQALKEKVPTLDWNQVIAKMVEMSHLKLTRFSAVVGAYKKVTNANLPISLFLQPCKSIRNTAIVAAALRFIIDNPDLMQRDFKAGEKLLPKETSTSSSNPTEDSILELWRYMPFVEAAVFVAGRERDFEAYIMQIFLKYPAGTFAALVACKPLGSIKHIFFASQILKTAGVEFINDAIITLLRKESAIELLIALFSEICNLDPAKATDVAELVVARRISNEVIAHSSCTKLTVATAILGKEANQIKEKWLESKLDNSNSRSRPNNNTDHRFAVASCILEVADDLLLKQKSTSAAVQSLNILINSPVAPFMMGVVAHARTLLQCDGAFQPDVEAEANEFFKRVYDDESLDAVAIVTVLYNSPKPHDKLVFNCIVNVLFEETRCLTDYPWKSLKLAARLFGQLIALELLPQNRLQTALRFIVATVSKVADAKTFEYGLIALEQIRSRIADWPLVGKQIKAIDGIDMRCPGIIATINAGVKAQLAAELAAKGETPAAAAAAAQQQPGAQQQGFHQHDIRVLMTEHNPAPPPIVQDQINFLVGNTDPANLETNAADLAKLLKPEFYAYFAEYLVIKRVALEPNFHKMYQTLAEKMNIRELERKIRAATVGAILKLLGSDKIRTNTSERSLLKNLGSWYGGITLAKNIPVMTKDMDFRELLINGLSEGKLIAVVPFIAKVLEQAAQSKFFRPLNPWTMIQLSNLVEMYHLPDLKLTLRFEVEVLCKNIGLLVADVEDYLRTTPRIIKGPRMIEIRNTLDVSGSTDFRADDRRVDTPPPKVKSLQADAAPYQPRAAPSAVAIELPEPPLRVPVLITTDNVRVGDEVNVIPQARHLHYRQALLKTLEATIKEVNPHVERSAVIAFMSTREIVVKDFCKDTDKEAMRRAGQAMVRSLASNLCTATIKEYLIVSLKKNVLVLTSILTENLQQRQDVTERIATANFDLCVRHLEYLTSEIAARKVDEFLSQHADDKLIAFQKREFPIYPSEQLHQMSTVPEQLRPNGPLSLVQRLVYDEFFQCIPAVELLSFMLRAIEEAAMRHYSQPKFEMLSLTNPAFTDTQLGDHHLTIRARLVEIAQLIVVETAAPFVTFIFSQLMDLADGMTRIDQSKTTPHWHTAILLNEVYLFVLQSTHEKGQQAAIEELTRLFLQHERRWKHCDVVANFIRLKAIDLPKFDEAFSKALNESSNRSVVEFAGQVIQKVLIDDKLATTKDLKLTLQMLETIARSTRNSSAAQSSNAPPQQQAPQQAAPAPQAVAPSAHQQHAAPTAAAIPGGGPYPPHVTRVRLVSPYSPERRAIIDQLFDEWVAICQKKAMQAVEPGDQSTETHSNQQASMAFVKKLQDASMLKPEGGYLDQFISVLTESSVEHYATIALLNSRTIMITRVAPVVSTKSIQPTPHSFSFTDELFTRVDAFTDLIVLLVRCCSWGNTANQAPEAPNRAEVVLVAKVLMLVAKVLQGNHDSVAQRTPGPDLPDSHQSYQLVFMQQPYVRFFSNLLIAMHKQPSGENEALSSANLLMRHFSDIYKLLSPRQYPGFAFGWLELMCHRIFTGRSLKTRNSWPTYVRLMCDGFRFADQFTKGSGVPSNVLLFFKGMLKIMLMLLHDFPEFVLTYHVALCDAIPPCCIQIRNVVLCAFPQSVKLPDPFQPTLQLDRLPEMSIPPPISDGYKDSFASAPNLPIADVEKYMVNTNKAECTAFVRGVVDKLRKTQNGVAVGWNTSLLNSLVLHVGILQMAAWGQEAKGHFVEQCPAMDLYRELAKTMDTEGRYYFLNACVNHLRYPNSHTHFFSHVALCLFLPITNNNVVFLAPVQEIIQEQVTRVLVERLIISRPHPWGLLITFVELIKAKRYQFWEKPFIRCTQEIEKMFDSLLKSVSPATPAQQ